MDDFHHSAYILALMWMPFLTSHFFVVGYQTVLDLSPNIALNLYTKHMWISFGFDIQSRTVFVPVSVEWYLMADLVIWRCVKAV